MVVNLETYTPTRKPLTDEEVRQLSLRIARYLGGAIFDARAEVDEQNTVTIYPMPLDDSEFDPAAIEEMDRWDDIAVVCYDNVYAATLFGAPFPD